MDIHKPHPVHNWRELVGEIGVIVIGVLIALGAEQAVETVHWRHKVEEAENAVRLELRDDDAPQAYARAMVGACLDQKVDRMTAALDSGAGREAYLAAARAYAPASRTWDTDAWRALVASDVGAHMGAERLVRWSDPYRLLPVLNEIDAREQRDAADARSLHPGREPISPAEADRLNQAVTRLRADGRALSARALFLLGLIKSQAGVTVTAATRAQITAAARARYGSACLIHPETARLGSLDSFTTIGDVFVRAYPGAAAAP